MTSSCVMNQVVQTHLLISKIDVNRIIQTCDSLVMNHNTTIKQLISLFSKISGYDSYCQQIVSLCNQILSVTVTSSNSVVNVCKSLKPIDLPPGPGSSTYVKNGDQIAKEAMSKACKVTRLYHNNVSPSSLKQPVGTRKSKPSISKRGKRSLLKSPIATINPDLPTVTSNPMLPIATSESELSIVSSKVKFQPPSSLGKLHPSSSQGKLQPPSSQGQLQTATSLLKSLIAKSKTDLFITNNKSQINIASNERKLSEFTKSTTNPKCTIETRKPELSVVESKSEFPIVTNKPELPIATTPTKLSLSQNKPEPTVKNSANIETFQTIDDISLLKNSGKFLKSHLISNSKNDKKFTKLSEAAPSVRFPVKTSLNVSHISSDSLCENVMDQGLETSGQGSFVEVIVGDDLNLSTLKDEGQVFVIIEGDETFEFNDVTNLYDELTIPVGKPNTTIATSKSGLSIATDKPNVTMVTSKPELFISTSKSEYNEFPIATDKPELVIATELSIATSPYQNNIKSSTIVEPTLKNSSDIKTTEAINNRFQSKAVNTNVLQSHSLQLSKQNKEFPKRRYPFQCSLCPKSFDRNKSLIRHTNVHATTAARLAMKPCQTFICEICGKIFKKRQRLREHKPVHLDHKPVACPHCDYRCVSKRYLTTHMIKHNGEKIHQCEKCGKCFNRIHSLRFHELIHNVTEKNFFCDVCPSSFFHNYQLLRHKKQMHENPIQWSCQVCGKMYNTKYYLSIHLRRHTTDERFTCDICGRKYKLKNSQRKHSKTCDGGEKKINDR
ncbi:zinc finger E-box-binding homeobox 1 [Patella vulgata]|uniref:zinc finger E-box-binding homeobox 1 n=1 Tax=Patella vulgata TaxID=6465 RepID=UPI002180339E|nr:zinc finger E-box-binding homeobox 1 [Patella vulgata]XP_050412921.1 zinc finger E-box-binding homeobox 1 [Patella vulgata]XP_050412922.1 zinc finger E-box-binding homeobox 1 [Patella vulgata]